MRHTSVLRLVLLMVPFVAGSVEAAEVRGRIRAYGGNAAPGDTTLAITCAGKKKTLKLTGDGSYTMRGLPSGSFCRLQVSSGALASRSTRVKPTARFSAQMRRRSGSIELIPE